MKRESELLVSLSVYVCVCLTYMRRFFHFSFSNFSYVLKKHVSNFRCEMCMRLKRESKYNFFFFAIAELLSLFLAEIFASQSFALVFFTQSYISLNACKCMGLHVYVYTKVALCKRVL